MPRVRLEGTALVVDDQKNVRTSLRALLEQLGFAVLEAPDGFQAIEVFRAHHATIDWVLMDLTMPRLNGYAAFLKLREIDPSVVVLLSSGWAEDEVASQFAACPPAGFLAKPFTLAELSAKLAQLGLTAADSPAR